MTKLYLDDAELYDIAFDWDVGAEVDWLYARLGQPASLFEPGCGSGRMLGAFARRGVEVAGIDVSPQMLALARERLGEGAELRLADITAFELGRTFDAAISPINTLLHLAPDELARHLACLAPHLTAHGAYLVQVGLFEPGAERPFAGSHWEASRGETSLRVDWVDEELDFDRGRSLQRSRIEVLSGERAGDVVEEIHHMTLWTPATWARAIESSPFDETATYDGGRKDDWPRVTADATGGLLWHELRISA